MLLLLDLTQPIWIWCLTQYLIVRAVLPSVPIGLSIVLVIWKIPEQTWPISQTITKQGSCFGAVLILRSRHLCERPSDVATSWFNSAHLDPVPDPIRNCKGCATSCACWTWHWCLSLWLAETTAWTMAWLPAATAVNNGSKMERTFSKQHRRQRRKQKETKITSFHITSFDIICWWVKSTKETFGSIIKANHPTSSYEAQHPATTC